jgi:uncharacterized protein
MIKGVLRVVACAAILCGATSVFAQQQPPSLDEPLMGSEAEPNTVSIVGTPQSSSGLPAGFGGVDGLYRILVIGDGLAGGFGAGVTRMIESDERFEVVNRFNEVSGLSRPELYDWTQAAPTLLATKPFDAVLIHLGLNDRQAIRTSGGRLSFKSDDWKKAYTQQVGRLLDGFRAANVRVYWVAVPPVANAELDADMQYLNAIFKTEVQARDQIFVDLRRDWTTPDGRFIDRGPDETGTERKLRSRDGITFMKQGNNRMGQLIVAAITSAEASGAPAPSAVAATGADVPATALPKPGTTVVLDAGMPQFGQQGLDGEDITFTPKTENKVEPVVAVADASAGQTLAQGGAKAIVAARGSAAETLLVKGISPAPELGRFDDFGIIAAP